MLSLPMKQNPWQKAGTAEVLQKVATYHRLPRSNPKRKLHIIKALRKQGFYYIYRKDLFFVDKILECVTNFEALIGTEYRFIMSLKRNNREIILNFEETDFRHITGLQHVDDIDIEQDPTKLILAIKNKEITDEILCKSSKYKSNKFEGNSIESRIEELTFLEYYLDNTDFLRIYQVQPFGSLIKADYFIEARLKNRQSTVYIFIRKREQSNKYVIVSFFKKSNTYIGTTMYFMLKEKITKESKIILYKRPDFEEK